MDPTNLWARCRGRYQRSAHTLFFRHPFVIKSDIPLISFTFDDFPRSSLLTGGLILNQFGARGTYYASLGLMGGHAPTGPIFLREDLNILLEQRHELGCHTFAHCHSWDTKPSVFEHSIIENRQALHDLLPGMSFSTFSYPITAPRVRTKRKVAQHFECSRGGGQTTNVGPTDLNYLSSFFLEHSRDDLQAVKNVIDRNQQVNGWLIFTTHDVCKNPTQFGCTPEFFEDVVRCAASSGARILPVAEAWETLRNSSPS